MPDGGTLTIETRALTVSADEVAGATLKPGRWACLTVTDSGPGIPRDVLEHVFEPFFTTKDVGKGTGLGLATVHGIIGQAGGEVRVYSEPGMGASFKVYLPALEASGSVPQPQPAAPPERLGGHETVLLCEDEPAVGALLERVLTRAGYEVLNCAAPDEALRAAAEHTGSIDILVTDVIMPGLTGPQLAERLVAEHGTLRTLFLSGYTADVIRDRGHLPPGSAFLEKPFEPPALLTAVRALLAENPSAHRDRGLG
jgi:two-component system cell cycle sensor histidine kinase/response regulator CckA